MTADGVVVRCDGACGQRLTREELDGAEAAARRRDPAIPVGTGAPVRSAAGGRIPNGGAGRCAIDDHIESRAARERAIVGRERDGAGAGLACGGRE